MNPFLRNFALSRLFLVLFIIVLLLLSFPFLALAKDYHFKKWQVDITINKLSTFEVIENITYDFEGEYHGASRTIMKADNILKITDFEVSEGDQVFSPGVVKKGQITSPGLFQVIDEGQAKRVNFSFSASSEIRTFSIKYKVIGGFNYYDKFDEFIWKAVAENREKSIEEVVVTVYLPTDVSLSSSDIGLNTDASNPRKEIIDSRTVRFSGTNLRPYGKFRVGIKLPKGVISVNQALLKKQKERAEAAHRIRYALPLSLCLSVLFVLFVFIVMLLLWWKRGRDISVPKVAEYLTEPPDKTPPAVVGEVLKETVGIAEINATIVDLARRGYLKIWKKPNDTLFEYLEDKGDLRPYERQLIDDLFGGRKVVELSSLKNTFYRRIPKIKRMIGEEAVRGGFYRATPSSVRRRYIGGGIALAILGGLLTLCVSCFISSLIAGPLKTAVTVMSIAPTFAVGISGVIVAIFGYFMPRKTKLGAEAKAKWEAFRDYLRNIKKFGKIPRAQEIFEQYLPYAVAFGLERVFTKAFSSKEVVPPIWFAPYWFPGYPDEVWAREVWEKEHPGESMPSPEETGVGGSGEFSLDQMSDSFFSMLNSVADTLLSSPTSTSSGGADFGGDFGGSAGGGGGADAW